MKKWTILALALVGFNFCFSQTTQQGRTLDIEVMKKKVKSTEFRQALLSAKENYNQKGAENMPSMAPKRTLRHSNFQTLPPFKATDLVK